MRTTLAVMLIVSCAASAALAQTSPPSGSGDAKAAQKQAPAAGRSKQRDVANEDALKSCMSQWEKSTHMSKQEWDRACRRVADRLQNLTVK